LNKLLSEATDVVDRYYTRINETTDATLSGAARVQAKATQQSLSGLVVSIDASLPTENVLKSLVSETIIQGAPSAAWWERQAGDVSFRFSAAIRQGMSANETNEQIVKRVATGVMDVARSNARSLVSTSIQTVANEARMETFKANEDVVKGVRQISTLDGNTTDICIAYSGGEWTLDEEPMEGTELPFNGGPPRHWNCRSILVPITKTFKELGLNLPEFAPIQRAASGGPVRADMTMKQWMDSRTEAQLNEQLGVGRAEMYRDGKITLTQLVDLRGNPLTLSELEKKYH
jgi:SPP1 gp7 family putative phage head morphogenesis protein